MTPLDRCTSPGAKIIVDFLSFLHPCITNFLSLFCPWATRTVARERDSVRTTSCFDSPGRLPHARCPVPPPPPISSYVRVSRGGVPCSSSEARSNARDSKAESRAPRRPGRPYTYLSARSLRRQLAGGGGGIAGVLPVRGARLPAKRGARCRRCPRGMNSSPAPPPIFRGYYDGAAAAAGWIINLSSTGGVRAACLLHLQLGTVLAGLLSHHSPDGVSGQSSIFRSEGEALDGQHDLGHLQARAS